MIEYQNKREEKLIRERNDKDQFGCKRFDSAKTLNKQLVDVENLLVRFILIV